MSSADHLITRAVGGSGRFWRSPPLAVQKCVLGTLFNYGDLVYLLFESELVAASLLFRIVDLGLKRASPARSL